MRDRDASEFATPWSETPPAAGFPACPDKAKTVSRAAVGLGALLLWFVPLGGALLLLAGSLGLVISAETPVGGPAAAASDR